MGNEKQFKFNQSVEARFDSAISAIEKKKPDKAKKELEEGKKLLSERQKLIKLADRSECGWATVSAYVTLRWRILLKTNGVFLKLKNRQRRLLTLKERIRGLNRVLLITNLIMLLFLMFLIHAAALTTLSSPFDRSPFSFDKPHFCPDLSSGEEPASLVDWKVTGETTAPISFLQEDQISHLSDVFDFEKSSESCLFKVGSLRDHVDFWSNSIRASDFIINSIVEGYRIPFLDLPENFIIPNRSSAFKSKDFVYEAISELIERGCVQEVLNPPKFINPLHVVQQSGGKCRLILDLSYLNKFIWKQSVRFEDIRTVFDLFQLGYFFFTFDFKSGYHHVEIFPDHRQYLGFSWKFGSVVKYFVFTVLPFGLSSAPYIFSKLVRSLVNYWRG